MYSVSGYIPKHFLVQLYKQCRFFKVILLFGLQLFRMFMLFFPVHIISSVRLLFCTIKLLTFDRLYLNKQVSQTLTAFTIINHFYIVILKQKSINHLLDVLFFEAFSDIISSGTILKCLMLCIFLWLFIIFKCCTNKT